MKVSKLLVTIVIILLCISIYQNWQMKKSYNTLTNAMSQLQLSIADPYSVNVLKAKDALNMADEALKSGDLNSVANYIKLAKEEFSPASRARIKNEDRDFLENLKSTLKSKPEGLLPSSGTPISNPGKSSLGNPLQENPNSTESPAPAY